MQQSYDIHLHGENEDRKEASISPCIIPAKNQQQGGGGGVDTYVVDHASSCVLPVSWRSLLTSVIKAYLFVYYHIKVWQLLLCPCLMLVTYLHLLCLHVAIIDDNLLKTIKHLTRQT